MADEMVPPHEWTDGERILRLERNPPDGLSGCPGYGLTVLSGGSALPHPFDPSSPRNIEPLAREILRLAAWKAQHEGIVEVINEAMYLLGLPVGSADFDVLDRLRALTAARERWEALFEQERSICFGLRQEVEAATKALAEERALARELFGQQTGIAREDLDLLARATLADYGAGLYTVPLVPPAKIARVFEGGPGIPGEDHPAFGPQELPLERVADLDAWESVAGRRRQAERDREWEESIAAAAREEEKLRLLPLLEKCEALVLAQVYLNRNLLRPAREAEGVFGDMLADLRRELGKEG